MNVESTGSWYKSFELNVFATPHISLLQVKPMAVGSELLLLLFLPVRLGTHRPSSVTCGL